METSKTTTISLEKCLQRAIKEAAELGMDGWYSDEELNEQAALILAQDKKTVKEKYEVVSETSTSITFINTLKF